MEQAISRSAVTVKRGRAAAFRRADRVVIPSNLKSGGLPAEFFSRYWNSSRLMNGGTVEAGGKIIMFTARGSPPRTGSCYGHSLLGYLLGQPRAAQRDDPCDACFGGVAYAIAIF